MAQSATLHEAARNVLSRGKWCETRRTALYSKCQALLARIVEHCGMVLAEQPVKAGEVAGTIPLSESQFGELFAAASEADVQPRVVWSDGVNELAVDVAETTLAVLDGAVRVTVPVDSDQTGRQDITILFTTGSPDRPAGLLFATETVPSGPAEIVDMWGDALIAFGWTALLRSLVALGEAAGRDEDGSALLPASLTSRPGGVEVRVMAGHMTDRIAR
jgi:hypothetical protein